MSHDQVRAPDPAKGKPESRAVISPCIRGARADFEHGKDFLQMCCPKPVTPEDKFGLVAAEGGEVSSGFGEN